jgi:hypothetical protein
MLLIKGPPGSLSPPSGGGTESGTAFWAGIGCGACTGTFGAGGACATFGFVAHHGVVSLSSLCARACGAAIIPAHVMAPARINMWINDIEIFFIKGSPLFGYVCCLNSPGTT